MKCLEELVVKSGKEKWVATLEKAGYGPRQVFGTLDDVPDAKVLELVKAAASVLGVSEQQAMDAFGEHWSLTYAPSIYGVYFEKCKSAREFLLSLAEVHVKMTRRIENAAPPQFDYDDSHPDILQMTYRSKRGLAALMPGLLKGVGKYYKEKLDVTKTGDVLRIQFHAAQSRRSAPKVA